ncbi:ABC transporter permease [Paenibacillus sp. J2TS4]|uniref:ABC transporter permease n=1 Tax=Paenibacillus sp. J2TS4 TaxID=2807194 RepID=UPI001B120487|nr:ABC transporter permease [Paenibacillus sp. J2TS4]GIP34820.1 hypothetical protein J2TS4_40300 [Paenibacillus sp. J2TS4]
MSNMMSVVRFTFKNRFLAKASIVSTIIFVVLISVVINLPFIISLFSSDDTTSIGITQSGSYSEQMAASLQQEEEKIKIVLLPDAGSPEANLQQAKERIDNGELTGYLEVAEENGVLFKAVYHSDKSLGTSEQSMLTTVLQSIKTEAVVKELGLSQEQLAKLNSPIELESMQLTPAEGSGAEKEPGEKMVAVGLVYVLVFLLFMSVMLYGNLISTEVTAEKSSRVMEILISSISPLTQMFGKVLGMLLLGLSQIGIYIVVAAINIMLPHNLEILSSLDIQLSQIPLSLIAGFLFFYLSGFLLYAFLFAAVGSLVSRTEDLGQAVTPLTFILLAGFYIGMFGLSSPDSTFVVVTSYIPFFTPMIMFLRVGLGEPALWEIGLSIVIMLASIGFFGWLSAKIYRVGVLMYGKRPSWKEVRKAMKAYNV